MQQKTKLTYRPLNLHHHRDLIIQYRVDAFICSFGNADKFWKKDPQAEQYIEWLHSKLAIDPNSMAHVLLDDVIIGQIELGHFKNDPKIGYVYLFYLVPEMRGKNLASQLDQYAMHYFHNEGYKSAMLSVSPSNTRVIKFYERMGWHKSDIQHDDRELIFMEKIPDINV